MPTYNRGDVVVVLYPFTDGSGQKPRPAVVVNNAALNRVSRDVIVAEITSRVATPAEYCDYDMNEWASLNLKVPSRIRVSRIASVDLRKVRKHLGHLSPADEQLLEQSLRQAFGL